MSPISLGVYGGARTDFVATSPDFEYAGFALANAGSSGTATTAYDVPIGAPASDRVVILAIGKRIASGTQIASVTINGTVAYLDAVSTTWPSAVIARALVPTGSTATVVITTTSTETPLATVSVYVAYGRFGLSRRRVHYTHNVASATVDLLHTSASATGTSSAIAVAASSTNAVSRTWSGLDEDNDYTHVDGPNVGWINSSAAHTNGILPGNNTVSVVASSNPVYQALAGVAYAPIPAGAAYVLQTAFAGPSTESVTFKAPLTPGNLLVVSELGVSSTPKEIARTHGLTENFWYTHQGWLLAESSAVIQEGAGQTVTLAGFGVDTRHNIIAREVVGATTFSHSEFLPNAIGVHPGIGSTATGPGIALHSSYLNGTTGQVLSASGFVDFDGINHAVSERSFATSLPLATPGAFQLDYTWATTHREDRHILGVYV